MSALVAGTITSCGRIGFDLIDLTSADVKEGGISDARAGDAATAQEQDTGSRVTDAGDEHARERGSDSAVRDAEASDTGSLLDVEPPPPPETGPRSDARTADSSTLACANPKTWTLGFDSDPTLVDSDNDGVLDWVLRNATVFPVNELGAGVWHSTERIVLDSRPLDPFSSRTVIDVRMRSVTVPASGRGAVFWVNLNEDRAQFSALFVNVMLKAGGGQTLELYGKIGNTETVLASLSNLPEAMVDVHLDIDPVALSVALVVNGVARGSYAIPETGPPNADHFATILAWDGVVDFDFIRIQRCPP